MDHGNIDTLIFGGNMSGILSAIPIVDKIIDRVIPNKLGSEEKAKLAHEIDVEMLRQRGSILAAEASSEDKWTSRARPSFLYVIYAVIIFNYIILPLAAVAGLTLPVLEIPDTLWQMFGIGYLGYVGGRTWEKSKVHY